MASTGDESVELALAHADRIWKAEEANATRIAARSTLILSVLTALLGLELFAIGRAVDAGVALTLGWRAIAFWTGIVLLTGMLVWSLILVFGFFRGRTPSTNNTDLLPTASAGMNLLSQVYEDPASWPTKDLRVYLFTATYHAAVDLQDRNDVRKRSLDVAQRVLAVALLLAVVSSILYTSFALEQAAEKAVLGVGSAKAKP